MNTKILKYGIGGAMLLIIVFLLFRGCGLEKQLKNADLLELQLKTSRDSTSKLITQLVDQKKTLDSCEADNNELGNELKAAMSAVKIVRRTEILHDSILYCPEEFTQDQINRIRAQSDDRIVFYKEQITEKDENLDRILLENAQLKSKLAVGNLTNQFKKSYPLPNLNKVAEITLLYKGELISEPTLSFQDLRQQVNEPKEDNERPVFGQYFTIGANAIVNNNSTTTKTMYLYNVGYGAFLGRRFVFGLEFLADQSFDNLGAGIKLGYRFGQLKK